jgi:hypothetical protein
VAIWYISSRLGILNKEKSGNPVKLPHSAGRVKDDDFQCQDVPFKSFEEQPLRQRFHLDECAVRAEQQLGVDIGKKSMILGIRVARWYIFKPKIQIWVKFVRCWYILCPSGRFYGHLVYFPC